MIGTYDIKLNAAAPNLPLAPCFSHFGSPSSFRILNVPKKIGLWEITNVFATVVYPDNSAHSVEAVKSGGVYVATVSAAAAPGFAKNGLEITANGLDENGEVVEGYVLGVADVYVLDRDGSITIGETTYYLHLVEAKSATPHKCDLVKTDDGWEIFDGSAWVPFGGGGSGSGATVLTTNGSKIFKGGVELTSYAALLALVQAGGVTLMGTVGADKDALYYPLFCDTTAIRFDATGTLGGEVKTKSYTVQPVNGDKIRVSEGSIVDLAKKSDIPDVSDKRDLTDLATYEDVDVYVRSNWRDSFGSPVDVFTEGGRFAYIIGSGGNLGVSKLTIAELELIADGTVEFLDNRTGESSYLSCSVKKTIEIRPDGDSLALRSDLAGLKYVGIVSRSFRETEIKNAAIITELTLPVSIFDGVKKVKALDIRCANNDSGSWSRTVSWTFKCVTPSGAVDLGTSDGKTMTIGKYTRFTFAESLAIPENATGIILTSSGATRIALVPTTDPGYTVKGATGSIITGYGVPVDVIGDLTIAEALELLAKRSLDPRGGVAANVNLTAPDGTRWALGVNNDGTLYTAIPDVSSASDEPDIEIE